MPNGSRETALGETLMDATVTYLAGGWPAGALGGRRRNGASETKIGATALKALLDERGGASRLCGLSINFEAYRRKSREDRIFHWFHPAW